MGTAPTWGTSAGSRGTRNAASGWLELSGPDAAWLARVSRTLMAAAGTRIGDASAAHVVLDGMDAGAIVPAGGPPLVLRSPSTVLAMDQTHLDELRRRTT